MHRTGQPPVRPRPGGLTPRPDQCRDDQRDTRGPLPTGLDRPPRQRTPGADMSLGLWIIIGLMVLWLLIQLKTSPVAN